MSFFSAKFKSRYRISRAQSLQENTYLVRAHRRLSQSLGHRILVACASDAEIGQSGMAATIREYKSLTECGSWEVKVKIWLDLGSSFSRSKLTNRTFNVAPFMVRTSTASPTGNPMPRLLYGIGAEK